MSARDWKARLFVLRRDATSQTSSLFCFKDTKKRWQKQVMWHLLSSLLSLSNTHLLSLSLSLSLTPQTPKEVIQLHPHFEVSLAHTSGYKFPLRLTVPDQPPLFLSAASYHLMNQWLYHIQTQRQLISQKRGASQYTNIPRQAITRGFRIHIYQSGFLSGGGGQAGAPLSLNF